MGVVHHPVKPECWTACRMSSAAAAEFGTLSNTLVSLDGGRRPSVGKQQHQETRGLRGWLGWRLLITGGAGDEARLQGLQVLLGGFQQHQEMVAPTQKPSKSPKKHLQALKSRLIACSTRVEWSGELVRLRDGQAAPARGSERLGNNWGCGSGIPAVLSPEHHLRNHTPSYSPVAPIP
jgi:hypothetical protein